MHVKVDCCYNWAMKRLAEVLSKEEKAMKRGTVTEKETVH